MSSRFRRATANADAVRRLRPAPLQLVPVTLAQANEHVAAWHRHNDPVVGHKYSIGVADLAGVLHAVAIVGRPTARSFDDGRTLEVTRVASDGTPNACSMLYGACARAGFALGYRRLVTYTQGGEPGTGLDAAGWQTVAQRPPRPGWDTPSRPRDNVRYETVPRQLWEHRDACSWRPPKGGWPDARR